MRRAGRQPLPVGGPLGQAEGQTDMRVRKAYDIVSSTLHMTSALLIFKSDKIASHYIVRQKILGVKR